MPEKRHNQYYFNEYESSYRTISSRNKDKILSNIHYLKFNHVLALIEAPTTMKQTWMLQEAGARLEELSEISAGIRYDMQTKHLQS